MRTLQKVTAGFCLAIALLFALAAVAAVLDQEETAAEKRSILLGLGILGGPPALVAGLLLRHLHQSHRQSLQTQQSAEAERLKDVFYALAEAQQGHITIFQFARAADVDAETARAYLDQQAKVFDASFDVGEHSEIIYRFPV